ncbi:MAG TPA: hypothetical protein VKF42_12450 [Chitinivibrionales bacterium]|nr:hypothetical protein [Chitinivibrionales bacterium]
MWIKLAQMHFHPQAHAPLHALMAKLTAAVDAGKIILPLSANHFVETLKVEDIERRRKLAKVMVAFSKGWMLAPEHAVVPLQLHNALSRTFNFDDEYEIKFLDKGIHFAFGITEDEYKNAGIHIQQRFRTFARRSKEPEYLEMLLSNPCVPGSNRKSGITRFYELANSHTINTEQQRESLEKYTKDDKHVSYVVAQTINFYPEINSTLLKNGKTFDDFLGLGKSKLMQFFADVPTLEIERELFIERNQDRQRPIQDNDLIDISFFSIGIPYCDVTVSEKFFSSLAKRRHLDTKYTTTVLDNLESLEANL